MSDEETFRTLVLKPKEGMQVKATSGLTDNRLFTGANSVHVAFDGATCLWYFRYSVGTIPPQLKGRFTKFQSALTHAREYFDTRGIEIVDVLYS